MASSDGDSTGTGLTAVLDVGKTHVKLAVIDAHGAVVAERRRGNAPVAAPGYPALDTGGIGDWLCASLAGLGGLRNDLHRIIATSHGAAFAALLGDALALPVPDYEFDGFDAVPADWQAQLDPFDATLAPVLPRGLNAATQFDWLGRHAAAAFDGATTLLPYPQFWAWWLCGVAASECSSLGCHTQLWLPRERRFSPLAQRRGWAARFAPLQPAWQVLGSVRPALARRLGLRTDLQVHCGAHDSNAGLARQLHGAAGPAGAGTLVSTGTWVVVMAPGALTTNLHGTPDLLANVSVDGRPVPTGRFMGGRELLALCAGADPQAATTTSLAALLRRGVMALPCFDRQGGPFRDRVGCVVDGEGQLTLGALTAAERATLALLYCADMTAWLVQRLQAPLPVLVDGPFAASAVFTQALAAMLPAGSVHTSGDALDGTARGAWLLTRWHATGAQQPPPLRAVAAGPLAAPVASHHQRWRQRLGVAAVTPVC